MALLTLVSVDRVVCADGCTDSGSGIADSRTSGHDDGDDDASNCDCDSKFASDSGCGASVPDHPHSCVLCTTGIDAPVALPTLNPLGLIGGLAAPALPIATSVPPPLLDHPPRPPVS
jgi:hypothetical protein